MKKACDKCKAEDSLTQYIEGGEKYEFCVLCSAILEKLQKTNFLHLFMNPKFSEDDDYEISRIDRDMLRAREDRARGDGKWK
jgi:hypothetical protein